MSSPAFVRGGLAFGGPKLRFPPRLSQIPERSRGSNFFPFTSTRLALAAGLADCGTAAVPVCRCPPACGEVNTVTEKNSTNPRKGKKRMRRFFIEHSLSSGSKTVCRTSRSCRRPWRHAGVLTAKSREERVPYRRQEQSFCKGRYDLLYCQDSQCR